MCKLIESSKEQHNNSNDIENSLAFKRLCKLMDELPSDRLEVFMEELEEKAEAEKEAKLYVEEKALFMSTKEFSRRTGIPVHKVRRWLTNGDLKGKKIARTWLVFQTELDRLAKEE